MINQLCHHPNVLSLEIASIDSAQQIAVSGSSDIIICF